MKIDGQIDILENYLELPEITLFPFFQSEFPSKCSDYLRFCQPYLSKLQEGPAIFLNRV